VPPDCMLEIERVPPGLDVVSPLVGLTTPAQPLSPRLSTMAPASAMRKNNERLLAENAALNI
jgi:hypothetical protein